MIGTIGREAGLVELPKHFLKPFRVPPGMKHSARTIPFTIFGNWEIWKGPVSSAATDFTAV